MNSRPLCLLVIALAALAPIGEAHAQASDRVKGEIFSCVDPNGKRITSDRLIAECTHREQRVLNADGSVNRIIPPTLTASERADKEASDRKLAAERAASEELVRRDRGLVNRFPDEAAHQRARSAALADVEKAAKASEKRLADLMAERKPLLDEAEFYAGKELPLKLEQQFDGNEASAEAQRSLMANQKTESARVNAIYDAELARLKQLWAGAAPGSLGPLAATLRAPLPASSAAAK